MPNAYVWWVWCHLLGCLLGCLVDTQLFRQTWSIVLSVLLSFTVSDYLFGIFTIFMLQYNHQFTVKQHWLDKYNSTLITILEYMCPSSWILITNLPLLKWASKHLPPKNALLVTHIFFLKSNNKKHYTYKRFS